ncbi:carboxypeptidase regulatory-like domain-containing protein [Silvibacterium sp.]|uniref:carboxypeptidase regulatory-like domain-containing protein n=1 Tax=Silvibacterium sp. TaxID=1964179 RepID=UPI0039E2FD6C
MGTKITSSKSLRLALGLALTAAPFATHSAFAQETGKLHGHAVDPVGVVIANSKVEVSTDGKTAKYTFTTDANGNYTGDGIAPGTYIVTLDNDQGKPIDQFQNVKITAGADTAQDFDLGRPEYVAKMSPEQRKQLEEVKAKNATAMKENGVIKNLNADLKTARDDNRDKNYAAADELMTKDTAAKPDAAVLWVELGVAQKGEKKLPEAETSLKKAVELDNAGGKPNPDIEAAANDALGEVLASEGKIPDAQAAYDAAAKAAATKDPKSAFMHYQNEAIMMDRAGNVDATVEAADKAIAADPNQPIPYYLKGKALINKATVDPKTQKIVAPPGCADAYQKYLELAPNGPFAADAKNILDSLGEKVQSRYKAK